MSTAAPLLSREALAQLGALVARVAARDGAARHDSDLLASALGGVLTT